MPLELIQLQEQVLVQHVQKGINAPVLQIKFNAQVRNINQVQEKALVQLAQQEVMYQVIEQLVILVLLDTNVRVMEQG